MNAKEAASRSAETLPEVEKAEAKKYEDAKAELPALIEELNQAVVKTTNEGQYICYYPFPGRSVSKYIRHHLEKYLAANGYTYEFSLDALARVSWEHLKPKAKRKSFWGSFWDGL